MRKYNIYVEGKNSGIEVKFASFTNENEVWDVAESLSLEECVSAIPEEDCEYRIYIMIEDEGGEWFWDYCENNYRLA